MLQQIRPYCGLVIYLLIISYVGAIGQRTICDLYYSVAYTARVLNSSADFWNHTEDHHHSQELALLTLQSLLENQEEDQSEKHHTSDVPNKKLKYFNHLKSQTFEALAVNKRCFSFIDSKSGPALVIDPPPPQG